MKTSFRYSSNAEQALLVELERQYPLYPEVVMREAYTGMGEEIRALNQQRVSVSNTLKSIVTGFSKLSNPAKSATAKAIMTEWTKLGSTRATGDYDVANAYVKKIIALLKSEDIASHITTLLFADELSDVEAAEKKIKMPLPFKQSVVPPCVLLLLMVGYICN